MASRRKFLTALGLSLAGAPLGLHAQGTRRTRWEMLAHNEVPAAPRLKPDPRSWDDGDITVAWIGHATVLINFLGTRIITDPVLFERVGLDVAGLFTIGPRRLVLPALTPEELPPIDLILLSHAHMDHLDVASLRTFDRRTPVVLAKNTADVIEGLGFAEMYELDWGQWTQAAGMRIDAIEVKHFGWRYPWENDRSRGYRDGRSYNAYLIAKNGRSILFGGDTAFHEHFAALRERGVELAILPIGAYDPWIRNHANPEQAVAMADQMGVHHILPIHYRTFIQSEEPTNEPLARLRAAVGEGRDRIVVDEIGGSWVCRGAPEGVAGASAAQPDLHHETE